jgi:transcriptional regulator GlxA family with amidase domain
MFLAFKLTDLVTVPFGWLLNQLYSLLGNYGVAMILFAILVQLILLRLYRRFPSFFPRESSEFGGLAEDVRRVLESDLEEKITLSELGERFHVSVYHLERLFRAQTGYAIGRYRLLCRIAAAREFLATTEMPVGEIAEKVGIGDSSNFSRYFRRETGYTPQEYRKRAQGK